MDENYESVYDETFQTFLMMLLPTFPLKYKYSFLQADLLYYFKRLSSFGMLFYNTV
jgi:hypothetical protein